MGSRPVLVLGLLFVIFLVASEVSARELAETQQTDNTNGLEESKYPSRGGCGRYGCGGGGGYYPPRGRCSDYGCCGNGGHVCPCCTSAAEAETYAAAQEKAKLQN